MASAELPTTSLHRLLARRGVRQFVKFCIVGASSTLIDFGVWFLLIEVLHLHRLVGSLETARPLVVSLAFLLAVSNGFLWNNRWTFRKGGETGQRQRYAKFVLTNSVGLALNLLIVMLVVHLLRAAPSLIPAVLQSANLEDPAGLIGKICATAVVVFWNFTASKYWTFKS